MSENEKEKMNNLIDELRAQMHYYQISLEANNAMENVIEKIERCINSSK